MRTLNASCIPARAAGTTTLKVLTGLMSPSSGEVGILEVGVFGRQDDVAEHWDLRVNPAGSGH